MESEIESYEGELKSCINFLPDFLRLFTNLLKDPNTPSKERLWINAAVAYIIAPYDILPEAVFGAEGYIEDIYLCSIIARKLKTNLGREELKRHWVAEEDIAEVTQEVYEKTKDKLEGKRKEILRYVGLEGLEVE